MGTVLVIKNLKVVRANRIHMDRRITQVIYLEAMAMIKPTLLMVSQNTTIATKNPKAANQNPIHTENRVMEKVTIVPRVATVTATKNPKAANQNPIHTENRVTEKVTIVPRVAMENLTVTKKVHTEDMVIALLNTLCIIKTNWV